MNWISVSLIGLFVLLIIVAIYYLIVGIQYKKYIGERSVYKGFSGDLNSVVPLSCPVEKKIHVTSGTVMCLDKNIGTCDPFLQDGKFNPQTTIDWKANLIGQCEDKNSCEAHIVNLNPAMLPCQTCSHWGIVGTYTCK